MLSEILKERTKTDHQLLEKLLVTRMKAIRSSNDYVDLLQLFYGYFGALEQKINQYVDTPQLADHHVRRKTESIAKDIRSLGGKPVTFANNNELPPIENHLQAFGALYVIEGSTLGGKIISNMMAKQLRINDGHGLSFFSGYGDDTDNMWEGFKHSLNQQAKTPEQESEVAETANQTFVKFKQWIEKNG